MKWPVLLVFKIYHGNFFSFWNFRDNTQILSRVDKKNLASRSRQTFSSCLVREKSPSLTGSNGPPNIAIAWIPVRLTTEHRTPLLTHVSRESQAKTRFSIEFTRQANNVGRNTLLLSPVNSVTLTSEFGANFVIYRAGICGYVFSILVCVVRSQFYFRVPSHYGTTRYDGITGVQTHVYLRTKVT